MLKMHVSQNDFIWCEPVKCLHLFSTLGRMVTQGLLGPEVPEAPFTQCKYFCFCFVCFILAFFHGFIFFF